MTSSILGDRQVGVALADVAGKGIAAALIMSIVQASLRSLTEMRNGSLAELAAKMNRLAAPVDGRKQLRDILLRASG